MTDLEFLSEAQAIANYEDELAEFINKYRKDIEFRKDIVKKYDGYVTYEERDECYATYFKDDILCFSTHLDKCIEKMFNAIRAKDYNEYITQNNLPF